MYPFLIYLSLFALLVYCSRPLVITITGGGAAILLGRRTLGLSHPQEGMVPPVHISFVTIASGEEVSDSVPWPACGKAQLQLTALRRANEGSGDRLFESAIHIYFLNKTSKPKFLDADCLRSEHPTLRKHLWWLTNRCRWT